MMENTARNTHEGIRETCTICSWALTWELILDRGLRYVNDGHNQNGSKLTPRPEGQTTGTSGFIRRNREDATRDTDSEKRF